MRKYVKPAHADATIPDPVRKSDLPREGREVEWSVHWAHLAAREDIIVSEIAEADAPEVSKAETDGPIIEGVQGTESAPQAHLPAPAEPAASDPAPGTVASVPFMITASDRRRLKALGKNDDEIRSMKAEDAQALLQDAPAA